MSGAVASVSKAKALYILFLLSLLTALNFYDRNLFNILVEPLKHEFQFSDGQIGLLSGLAFATVYSLFSIPIARFADGGRRVAVLGTSGLLWSLMTGVCGLATGFATMLVGRFGVGIGEAGAAPTTHAIIAETFSVKRRATALSVIGLAGGIGVIAALAGGGHIAQQYGWRVAFYAGAVPGLLIAGLFVLTVRNKDDGASSRGATSGPTARATFKVLAGRRSYFWLSAGMALSGIGAYGAAAWMPAFFMRRFALSTAQIGTGYSAMVGTATLVGIVLGGVIGDVLSKRDARAPFFILATSYAITGPMLFYLLIADNYATALSLVFPMTLVSTIWISPAYAAVQALSGAKYRAMGAAGFMLIQNLIGQGFGPSIVGLLSDLLVATHGADSLRIALLIVVTTYLFGSACFLIATRTARADIAEANLD